MFCPRVSPVCHPYHGGLHLVPNCGRRNIFYPRVCRQPVGHFFHHPRPVYHGCNLYPRRVYAPVIVPRPMNPIAAGIVAGLAAKAIFG